MSIFTGLFFLVLLLNQRWSPPLRLQASHCSTFRIMCDVPSMAVFCSESIEWFPGTASNFFFRLLVTIPVAPVITGIIVHFMFHIRCISTHKLLYFNFFSASFCTTFLSAGTATSISVHGFSLLLLLLLFLRYLQLLRGLVSWIWQSLVRFVGTDESEDIGPMFLWNFGIRLPVCTLLLLQYESS